MSDVSLARRTERREREHAHARGAILSAARTLAAREGAEALTLRAVAQEAGYAPAALYGYFASRADLVMALAADELGALARALREAPVAADGKPDLAASAKLAVATLCSAAALPDALAALDGRTANLESERLFNGRLIAVLRALSAALGGAPGDRASQGDTLVFAAAISGLALLARTTRLDALGFSLEELVDRLDNHFSAA